MTLLNSHNADNHSPSSPVTLTISTWDVMASATERDQYFAGYDREKVLQRWTTFAEDVAKRYIALPNYRRIGDRPVIMRGLAHNLLFYNRWLIKPEDITSAIRDVIPDAYLVATSTEREVRPLLKSWGFDAHSDYLLHGRGWDNTMEVYRWAWSQGIQIAKDTGCKYWPSATSGYDGTAWDTPESRAGFSHVPTPEQFTSHIREAKKFASDNYEWTDAQLVIYSMDEFGEQVTPLEPTVRNGDAYLRALKDAA